MYKEKGTYYIEPPITETKFSVLHSILISTTKSTHIAIDPIRALHLDPQIQLADDSFNMAQQVKKCFHNKTDYCMGNETIELKNYT